MNTFIPVTAPEKKAGFKTTEPVVQFPEHAILTVQPVEVTTGSDEDTKKRPSKQITLSPKAIEALELKNTENECRFGITRGVVNVETQEEGLYIFKTTEAKFPFLNEKGNNVKKTSAKLNMNTYNALSATIHEIISNKYIADASVETHFQLTTVAVSEAGTKYWLLAPFVLEDTDEEVISANPADAEITEDTADTPGEVVDVVVE